MVYQIDDTTAVASQPALPTDSIGTPGFFTGGSTSGGAPTRVRYWWLNMVQQELLNIALAAGLTADKTDNTQCITAIKALAKQAAGGAVLGSPGVLATGDVAGSVLYHSAALAAPAFTYGSTTVGLATTTALTSALGNYLPLGGGNVTGDMDWGSKTAAGTVTHRFWSAGSPATGDATPDATITATGGTPGTANAGTFRLSTGTFDLSGSGRVLVPDVVDFTTQGALSARVAEGRYVGSVLAAGSTNVRITDIQEDASGNMIATLGDGTTQKFYSSANALACSGGLTAQVFTVIAADGWKITFPVAFSARPFLFLQPRHDDESDPNATSNLANYYEDTLNAGGFTLDLRAVWGSNGTGGQSGTQEIMVLAIGDL